MELGAEILTEHFAMDLQCFDPTLCFLENTILHEDGESEQALCAKILGALIPSRG